MADVVKRTIVRTRHEYVLPSPTTAQELAKALRWVDRDLGVEGSQYGDAYMVEARDDEIVVWFEEGEDQ